MIVVVMVVVGVVVEIAVVHIGKEFYERMVIWCV